MSLIRFREKLRRFCCRRTANRVAPVEKEEAASRVSLCHRGKHHRGIHKNGSTGRWLIPVARDTVDGHGQKASTTLKDQLDNISGQLQELAAKFDETPLPKAGTKTWDKSKVKSTI
jgi:hypothetical protein